VIDLPGVASLVRNRVKDAAPAEGFEKVNVQLPVKVAVIKFPFAKFIVAAVPVFPTAFTTSPKFTIPEESFIIVVLLILNAIFVTLGLLLFRVL